MDIHIETHRGAIIEITVHWLAVLVSGLIGAVITAIAVFRPKRGN